MKVLGMGNALVDIMTLLNDDGILERFHLQKGSMTLVDRDLSNYIHIETTGLNKTKTSGGSAANTIHGLTHLGIEAAFIGKIGSDEMGHFFKRDMEVNNITPILFNSLNDTGRAVALVSKDSERTFATYLGAAVELSDADLSSDIFQDFDYFYVEGYLISNQSLIEKSLHLARKNKLKICIDLASYNIVEQYRESLLDEINKYVDIVFANEDEAFALTGLPPVEALDELAKMAKIAVVKVGQEGSYIKSGDEFVHVPALSVNSIDTTGAGDLYAAGFLYGLSFDLSLEKCGRIGTILAGNVIEIIGAKMKESTWENIRREVKMIQEDEIILK
jgi:sugar/nucleoside kinase (ribokinase family)